MILPSFANYLGWVISPGCNSCKVEKLIKYLHLHVFILKVRVYRISVDVSGGKINQSPANRTLIEDDISFYRYVAAL